MRHRAALIVFGLVVLYAALGFAQEAITLTTPETKPMNTKYRLGPFYFDEGRGLMVIVLRGDNAEEKICTYDSTTNPTGEFLIRNLQKANLGSVFANNATTGSLKQRINYRLHAAGLNEAPQVCNDKQPIVGTMTGSVP